MSRRHRQQPDSLELLLDTICNTFGGIILIALLIALLSRDSTSDAAVQQRQQNIERQLAQTKNEADEAQILEAQLEKRSADPGIAAAMALLNERDQLRREIAANREAQRATATAEIPAIDPSELSRLQERRESATNEIRLLTEQIKRETDARKRQLRLPRERVTGKRTFYFIARYGRLYPVHLLIEGRRDINSQTIDWSSEPDGERATPRRDMGIDVATALPALARAFNDIPSETYSIHFLVYADSFAAFLNARQIPLGRGYDVGWEFLPEDRPVVFSSRGAAPPAL